MRRLLPFLVVLAFASVALAGTFTNEVLVLNSAAVKVTTTNLTSRRAVEIQNQGPNAIFCAVGAQADAVLTKSRKLDASGGVWSIDLLPGRDVWCKAATADQATAAATVVTEVD